MNAKSFSLIALACAALAGCSAQVDGADEIGVAAEAATLQQCLDQRNACVAKYGFLGALTTCPIQYTQCTATASNGLPAEVTGAIKDAAACTDAFEGCVTDATTATALTACAEDQAICVAGILDVDLPKIVTGTTECVDGGVDCINAAESVGDLTACGETLADCAIEQAETIIPDEVIAVVDEVNDCTAALNACVNAAATPAALTACGEKEAVCVAGSLNVDLPNVPVSEVVECTDAAADCALAAESVADVTGCADELLDCTAAVVESLEAPPVLDCGQVWTACMLRNPFGFLTCAAERRKCDAAK